MAEKLFFTINKPLGLPPVSEWPTAPGEDYKQLTLADNIVCQRGTEPAGVPIEIGAGLTLNGEITLECILIAEASWLDPGMAEMTIRAYHHFAPIDPAEFGLPYALRCHFRGVDYFKAYGPFSAFIDPDGVPIYQVTGNEGLNIEGDRNWYSQPMLLSFEPDNVPDPTLQLEIYGDDFAKAKFWTNFIATIET